jgi:hypothetical protein
MDCLAGTDWADFQTLSEDVCGFVMWKTLSAIFVIMWGRMFPMWPFLTRSWGIFINSFQK